MKRNPLSDPKSAVEAIWELVERVRLGRWLVLILVAGVAAGCADDVVMKDPRTGATETCHESLHGLDPWSQTMSCVGSHEAQGWTIAGHE